MEINEYILRLTGKVSISEPLTIDTNYSLALHGSISAITEESNEDGSSNHIFKFQPLKCEILTPEGKTIKAKDSRRLSQKLRARIFIEWKESSVSMDFDEYYNKRMGEIITNI